MAMKHWQRRLQRLEQRVNALPSPRPVKDADDGFSAWCQGGCTGPLPAAGPRPAKYSSDEAWQQNHRFLLALMCASVGQDYPPEMTEPERREVDDTLAFFASIDPTGELSLNQQAELAPYTVVIEQFLTDEGGGSMSAGPKASLLAKPPQTRPFFQV
jgi:hypothetical protein